jgi:hypothetical protein
MERPETLDEASISRLREFFELLERWDRDNGGETIGEGGEKR